MSQTITIISLAFTLAYYAHNLKPTKITDMNRGWPTKFYCADTRDLVTVDE